jgi:hypothetical protein
MAKVFCRCDRLKAPGIGRFLWIILGPDIVTRVLIGGGQNISFRGDVMMESQAGKMWPSAGVLCKLEEARLFL